MKRQLMKGLLGLKNHVRNFFKEENGDSNIIAVILIIIVVIALVAIFREQLISIVTGLFDQIKESLGLA